ncbi:hypothetical protein PP176A_0936 [Sporanaerobacter sp. PP17-6a]|nr:hypothetical protein PP176A_0936 [Sporanaerobacter sp. PP17-6a]
MGYEKLILILIERGRGTGPMKPGSLNNMKVYYLKVPNPANHDGLRDKKVCQLDY